MVGSSGGMTVTSPKRLVTCRRVICPMGPVPLPDRAERQSAHALRLAEPAEDKVGGDGHGRGERRVAEPGDRLGPEQAPQMREKPVGRVHEHGLADQRGHGRHDEEGRDDQDTDAPLAPERLVRQQRQQHAADDDQGGPHAGPGRACGDDAVLVVEAGPAEVAAAQGQAGPEREPQRHGRRDRHPARTKNDGRCHHPARGGSGLSDCHGA
jgi:hypothetical protein